MTTTETPQTGAELRASIVQDAAEIIRRHQGSPAEDAADALIDMIEQRTLMPLAGELGCLRGVLDGLRTRLEEERTRLRRTASEVGREPENQPSYAAQFRTVMGGASGVSLALEILAELYPPAGQEGEPS